MHQTRNEMPKTWPIVRKGTKYLAVASHAKSKGIPVLFVLRDILKLVKTRSEARYMMLNGDVKINNKVRKDEKFPIQVFGSVSLEKTGKHYQMIIENKKFALKEISAKEAEMKIVKVSGKKTISSNQNQVNLEDGHNFILKEKLSAGDSVVVNTKEMKIVKVLPLKEGSEVLIVGGKHIGQKGKIKSIAELERGKTYSVEINKKEVSLPLRTLLVIE